MKKTSKLFGAVALSAALAMGAAMPAFAETYEDAQDTAGSPSFATNARTGDVQEITNDGTAQEDAQTVVNLRTENDQINCELPLKVTVVAKVGGGNLLCPSDNAYKITNKSDKSPVYVTDVKASLASNWKAASDTSLPAGKAAETNVTAADHGAVFMQITQGGEGTPTVLVGNSTYLGADSNKFTGEWTIPTANSLKLKLEGAVSAIKELSDLTTSERSGVELLTVTYTVSTMSKNASTLLAEEDAE